MLSHTWNDHRDLNLEFQMPDIEIVSKFRTAAWATGAHGGKHCIKWFR